MPESEYNRDQSAAIFMVRKFLRGLSTTEKYRLMEDIAPYLNFRADVDDFQNRHFSKLCIQKCFTDRTSACCNREGIATFFADIVLNALVSTDGELDQLEGTLHHDRGGFKCVYLSRKGCIWRLKPIVCEMFLCSHAKETVFSSASHLRKSWEALRLREKQFTWPDRPVLFDELEKIFIEAGYDSPLMYCHKSPGLLRLKAGPRRKR